MPMAAENTQKAGNQDTMQLTGGQQGGAQATQTPRQSGQDDQHPRLAKNVPSDQTVPEQVYADYALTYDEDDAALNAKIPDVLVDAPVVSLKGLDFELDDLRAKVSLFAKVLDLVELSVGIDAYLGKVKLTIESIDVQALVKVRLDNVTAIIDRVLTTIDRNPQIIQELTRSVGSAVENVGEGAGQLVGEGVSEAVSEIGSGAGSAVEDVGEGAGEAVEDLGKGAGSAVEDVGGGAGEAVGEVGRGAGQAAQEVGQGAGEAVGEVGQGAGQAAQEVGQGAGQVTQQAGEVAQQAGEVAQGVGDTAGQAAQGATEATGQTAQQVQDATRQAAGQAQEAAGPDVQQAQDDGAAQATEQGDSQPQGASEQAPAATPAAERLAEQLGVDLAQIEGSGVGGRITVTDVRGAAQKG
jgi:hypothetical protein